MEMTNIFDDLEMNENGKSYMHLVPTSTAQPLDEEIVFEDEEYPYVSWTDSVMNRVGGCGHKMSSWYYGEVDDETAENDDAVEVDVKFVEETRQVDAYYGNADVLLV